MVNIIINILRAIFTLTDIAFLYVLARYLINEHSGIMSQILVGDLDHTSDFYLENQRLLAPKIRQIYFANFIFITLFTLCLWASTFVFQVTLAFMSLLVFIGLLVIERKYQKVLKQLGDELK